MGHKFTNALQQRAGHQHLRGVACSQDDTLSNWRSPLCGHLKHAAGTRTFTSVRLDGKDGWATTAASGMHATCCTCIVLQSISRTAAGEICASWSCLVFPHHNVCMAY